MTETNPALPADLSDVVCNAYGEHCLFAINRNVFQGIDASTVFRSYFEESLCKENTFYLIAGTDSGLLYQYIKVQGVPKGSRYLFVELPEVLERLVITDDQPDTLAVTTPEYWKQYAITSMDLPGYGIQDRMVLVRSLGVVHGHYSPYLPFCSKLKEEFDSLRRTYRVGLNNRPFLRRQIENLTENQTPALCLKDAFRGHTAVILAGGPSLDQLLPWVREHRDELLVIAVSRISDSLIQAGVQPDVCISVDPYDINFVVSKEMLEFQDDTLLVNEFHLSANLLSSWGGKKVYLGKRYPWPSPLQPENMRPSIGATVTNSAVAFAVDTGVAQIILGGVDFCFSQSGHTHANGSAEHALGPRPMLGDKRVETNSGAIADSLHSFLNSAHSVELQAQQAAERGCRVINPAPGAMRLANVEHLPLESIQIEPMSTPVKNVIAAKVPPDTADRRIDHYQEVLGEVDRVLEELRAIKTLSLQALDHNRRFFDEHKRGNGSHNHAKLESIEKRFKTRYADTVNFIKQFGLERFIPVLGQDNQDKEGMEESGRLYFQALMDVSTALTDHLGQARVRILSRLEEEKPNPDIHRLLKQWRQDHHPGRAILWAKRRADYVNGLPQDQQQALREFQESFDDTLAELTQLYRKGIEKEGRLDGMHARAREYFRCRDEEGLLGLQASLEQNRDQQQAQLFLPLVQGYLAELHNDAKTARAAYRKLTGGPSQIDALMRLFELHVNDNDTASALEVLKTLSDISPVYTPMYAEMLRDTGEIQQAVDVYTDYLLEHPDDLSSVMKLGKIYHQHGAMDGVQWAMNYILDKDPNNHAAKAMLASSAQTGVGQQ